LDQPEPTDDPAAVIPVERIAGPVLLVCGDADRTWPSCAYSESMKARLQGDGQRYGDILLSYGGAGHGVGTMVPYQPGTSLLVPYSEGEANATAEAQAWPHLLGFLGHLGR
jgi:hypothetical protein